MTRDSLSFYEQRDKSSVTLVSIPYEYGSDARGLKEAPNYLFEHGLARMFDAVGIVPSARESIACPAPTPTEFPRHLSATIAVARATFDAVSNLRAKGERVVALCGDHASAIGTIRGAASSGKRVGLIYIDAHPDIHTEATSISGNTHGMVAASAMGKSPAFGSAPSIPAEDVLYIGIKDFDPSEIPLVRESGAEYVTMHDIVIYGLGFAVEKIEALAARVDEVWVSMDMDSIDQACAPGVAMPSPDGFTRREILALARTIGNICPVVGIDVVEVLPGNDIDHITANLAAEIVALLLGYEYSSYRSYMAPYEAAQSLTKRTTQRAKHRSRSASST